jgi:glycosyltransferase involved in cell wall biosynthesis
MPRSYTMRWAMSRSDGIVTYSNRIMERDRAGFGLPEERLCIIPPGIRPYDGEIRDMRGEFGIGEKEKVIGVIGRLKPDRGYDVILKAFKRLCEEMDGVRLLVMGRSSQIEESIMRPRQNWAKEGRLSLRGYG